MKHPDQLGWNCFAHEFDPGCHMDWEAHLILEALLWQWFFQMLHLQMFKSNIYLLIMCFEWPRFLRCDDKKSSKYKLKPGFRSHF